MFAGKKLGELKKKMSVCTLECLYLLDEAEYDSKAGRLVELAAEIAQDQINRTGGIAGTKVAIRPRRIDGEVLTALDTAHHYLSHSQAHPSFCVYPFAGVDPDKLELYEDANALWFGYGRIPENRTIPRNMVVMTPSMPRNEVVERIKRCKSAHHVIYIATEKAKRLWRGGAFSKESGITNLITSDCSSLTKDDLAMTFKGINSREVILVILEERVSDDIWDYLEGSSHRRQIEVVSSYDLLNETKPREWFFREDLSPNIELIKLLNQNVPTDFLPEISKIATEFKAFETLFLLQYVSNAHKIVFDPRDPELFIRQSVQGINTIDGTRDIYCGLSCNYLFSSQKVISEELYLYKTHKTVSGDFIDLLSDKQPSPGSAHFNAQNVVYAFIDIIKVSEVDLAEGYWVAEFELDCAGAGYNLIEHLQFHNLNQSKPRLDVSLVSRRENDGSVEEKYRVIAHLVLDAEVSLYPFDIQELTVELRLTDTENGGYIQPTPIEIMDQDFVIPGWKILNKQSGIRNRKEIEVTGAKLDMRVGLSRNPVCSWFVKRTDTQAFVKSLIPLTFLLMLSWGSTFFPLAEAKTALSINTTLFLASIALYFSADRPKVSGLTLIDNIFVIFYLSVGIVCLALISVVIEPDSFNTIISALRIVLPALAAGFIFYIFRKLRLQLIAIKGSRK